MFNLSGIIEAKSMKMMEKHNLGSYFYN